MAKTRIIKILITSLKRERKKKKKKTEKNLKTTDTGPVMKTERAFMFHIYIYIYCQGIKKGQRLSR